MNASSITEGVIPYRRALIFPTDVFAMGAPPAIPEQARARLVVSTETSVSTALIIVTEMLRAKTLQVVIPALVTPATVATV